jgi:hypothetical protein
MSQHTSGGNHDPGLEEFARLATRGVEAGAAMYALDHAAKGTPIGAEGDFVAQATRTGGNFVIAAVLWHVVIAPYLVITAILFAVPTIAVAAIGSHDHWHGIVWLSVVLIAVVSVWLWCRYAIRRWLWRRFIRPVDATLSGRTLGDPARRPATRFRDDPKQYLVEYNELSRQATGRYLGERAETTASTPPADAPSTGAGSTQARR